MLVDFPFFGATEPFSFDETNQDLPLRTEEDGCRTREQVQLQRTNNELRDF